MCIREAGNDALTTMPTRPFRTCLHGDGYVSVEAHDRITEILRRTGGSFRAAGGRYWFESTSRYPEDCDAQVSDFTAAAAEAGLYGADGRLLPVHLVDESTWRRTWDARLAQYA